MTYPSPVYPNALVGAGFLPEHLDGEVIYGAHVNKVQAEVIAIEAALGVGNSGSGSIPDLFDNGAYSSLVARLDDYKTRLLLADSHRAASSGVHGVSGNVVGTSGAQTLSGKTLASPAIAGSVAGAGVTWDGNITFANDVTVTGTLTATPHITNFTQSQHDHTSASTGGNIPISAVTGLTAALSGSATAAHTHVKADITNFQHTLAEHTGSLDAARVSGLGTSALLNVPSSSGVAASATQVVRGDDPRLVDGRTAAAHAATHAAAGSDPVTPASIGAATASHTHTKAQITDFAHTLIGHPGNLTIDRVNDLQTALDGKLGLTDTAINATKVQGHRIFVQQSAPGSPVAGDVWIDF